MDETIPTSAELVTMGSVQAALFEDPTRLLSLSDREMAQVVADLHGSLGQVMPGIRRAVGMLAWAQWHRLTEGKYHGWLDDTANLIGVDTRTVIRWRQKVTTAEHLAIPTLTAQRQLEQETAGQAEGSDTMSEPDPATPAPPPAPTPEPPPPAAAPAPPDRDRELQTTLDASSMTPRHVKDTIMLAIRSALVPEVGPEMSDDDMRDLRRFIAACADARNPAKQEPAKTTLPNGRPIRPTVDRPKRPHPDGCGCAMCADSRPKGAKR